MNTGDVAPEHSSDPNHTPLVTFEDIAPFYVVSEDIFVEYRQKRRLGSTVEDWVGVFPVRWLTLDECVGSQLVPKPTRRNKKILQKVLRIPADTIEAGDPGKEYQFVYVTRDKRVAGTSAAFTLRQHTEQYDSELGEFELLQPSSDNSDTSTCMFDSFFLVDEMQNQLQEAANTISDDVRDLFAGPISTANDDIIVIPDEREPSRNRDVSDNPALDVVLKMEPEAEDQPTKSIERDHVTLATDFTVTPSGTAMMNHLDFVIDFDPAIRQYLENPIRSLLPIMTEQQALIPYQAFNPFDFLENLESPVMTCSPDPAKDNSNLSAMYELLNEAPPPPQTQPVFSPPPTQAPRETSCRNCGRKTREYKLCRSKLRRARNEQKRLVNELDQLRVHTEDQEMMLSEFSTQIRELVHDKSQLILANDEFHQEIMDMQSTQQRQTKRITTLRRKLTQAKEQKAELEENIMLLSSEISSYQTIVEMTEVEREMLQQRCDYQECEAVELCEKYAASESLLDDIMYTLSVQGYTKLVDINGEVIDLTKKQGSRIELYGWSMAQDKRDELHMLNLARQEEQLADAKQELLNAQGQLEEKTIQLNWFRNLLKLQELRNESLTDQVEEMTYRVNIAEEKEAALHNLLVQERRKNNFSFKRQQEQQTKSCETEPQRYCVVTPNTLCTNPEHKPTAKTQERGTQNVMPSCNAATQNSVATSNKATQKLFHSDTKLFKSYSDALKFTAAKNRSCGSYFGRPCKNIPDIEQCPEICKKCPQNAKPTQCKPTEPTAVCGEMLQRLLDDPKPLCFPTSSSIINSAALGSSYQPGEAMQCSENPKPSPCKPTESTVLRGEMLQHLFDDPKPICIPTPSSIINSGVLSSLYKPYERQPRQQDSSILKDDVLNNLFKEKPTASVKPRVSQIVNGGVLNKLYKEQSDHVSPQVSKVLCGNVLNTLFKDSPVSPQVSKILNENVLNRLFNETPTPVSPRMSKIVDGNVLNNLFRSDTDQSIRSGTSSILDGGTLNKLFESDESVSSQSSSILDGEILNNLFKETNSNEAIGVMPQPDIDASLEFLFERHVTQDEHSRPLSLDEFTFLLDRALSIVFSPTLSAPASENPSTPQDHHNSRQSSTELAESDMELIPLLDEFSFPNVNNQVVDEQPRDVMYGPYYIPPAPPLPQHFLRHQTQPDEDEGYSSRLSSTSTEHPTPNLFAAEDESTSLSETAGPTARTQKKPRKFHYSTFGTTRRRKNKKSANKSFGNRI